MDPDQDFACPDLLCIIEFKCIFKQALLWRTGGKWLKSSSKDQEQIESKLRLAIRINLVVSIGGFSLNKVFLIHMQKILKVRLFLSY